MKITAVVPVRKGSQRVPSKNLRPFADTTILELKIKTLKESNLFDDIVVNTDSDEAIAIAIANGVSYHKRDEYFASSVCSGSDFAVHLAETTDTDIFVYSPSTSPFTTIETMRDCLNKFNASEDTDCVSTVTAVKDFLWLDGKAINYDPQNTPRSQDLPGIVALNFGFTVIAKETIIKNKNFIGTNPIFVVTGDVESIDIDDELDFYIAEQIYKRTMLEKKTLIDKI